MSGFEAFKDLSMAHYIPPDNEGNSCVVVKNKFDINIEFDSQDRPEPNSWWQAVCDFQNKCVEEYLKRIVRLMRLFKEGTICLPIARYFYYRNGTPRLLMGTPVDTCLIVGPPYILKEQEVTRLQIFLQKTNLPFGEPFLQLAFESFEVSYEVYNLGLAFLSLMISLETMLNPDDREPRYRVSRNAAVLLGSNPQESERIFSEVRGLYDKRSKLVHTGENANIGQEDGLKLRGYVKEAIKEMNMTGQSKDELLETLNACGFGQRPWRE